LNPLEAFRQIEGELWRLEKGPNGYLCSEGELIVFQTHTPDLPELLLCGETLNPKSLRRQGRDFIGIYERLIDTWAGRTVFVLRGGLTPQQIHLDIGPHEKKLGVGAWEELIQELSQISNTLPWGMSPGAAAGRITPDALASVHPAIIEQQLPIFCRLLRRLLADPPIQTFRIRTVRPLDVSRRADLRTVRWLSNHPLELAGIRGLATEDQRPNPRALVDQPEIQESRDHPVTRYVAYLLERVRRRLVTTVASLRQPAGHGVPDPSATIYARQLAENVELAVREIERVQRAPLFHAVRPEPLTDSVIQSLPDHPLYSAIHRVGCQLISPGLAFAPEQDIYSALKHSYDLFELAVLYRLVAGVSAGLPPDWHLTDQGSVKRLPREDRPPDGSIWIWTGPDEQELEMYYQARFASAVGPPDIRPFSSLSVGRVPDYVLVYRRSNVIVRWIILDAKYRSSRHSIHEALGDIHRYRDSLRMSGRAADAAYIIVPCLQDDAELYGRSDYLKAHQLGAISTSDDSWIDPIWNRLQLSSPSTPTSPHHSYNFLRFLD
jgi:hypothetical protein